MYAPDPPDRGIQRTIRCQPADIEETQKARAHARAAPPRENLGYLDRLIQKPWGSEFRVYEDDVREAWCLHLEPHRRTSLHCHPNKLTALICLQGSGTLSTCTGMHYALEPGVVVQIEPGAYHRSTSSATGLRLVEVEAPKDKFDLLRIEDDYRDVTEPYEGADHAPLRLLDAADDTAPAALQPFTDQRLSAYRWGRLRANAPTDRYRFAVQAGAQIRAATNVLFAIALQGRPTASHGLTVLALQCAATAAPETVYLTIRVL
jgi:mannose-6-phosphate isomerase-like protein (cupin superfamily)